MEGKIKNQPSHSKNSYFLLNSHPDTSYESVSEADNTTPRTATVPCASDLDSLKEHVSVLNTVITAMRSLILEKMVIFVPYQEQNSQYIYI